MLPTPQLSLVLISSTRGAMAKAELTFGGWSNMALCSAVSVAVNLEAVYTHI